MRSTTALRRIVGDEVTRQLGRDMPRGLRPLRQILENGLTLLHAVFGVALAQQALRARLVEHLAEEELARLAAVEAETRETPALVLAADRPAGNGLGEGGDVGLGVAAVDAERVQFEDFARQVFVDVELAAAAFAAA